MQGHTYIHTEIYTNHRVHAGANDHWAGGHQMDCSTLLACAENKKSTSIIFKPTTECRQKCRCQCVHLSLSKCSLTVRRYQCGLLTSNSHTHTHIDSHFRQSTLIDVTMFWREIEVQEVEEGQTAVSQHERNSGRESVAWLDAHLHTRHQFSNETQTCRQHRG